MQRREFLKTGAAAVGGAFVIGMPAIAKAATSLKFDSYVSDSAGPSWVDSWYLDELEKRTNGEVTVRRYWSGSLNKVGEHLAAARDGTSEITLIAPGYYQAELPVTRGLEWYFRMTRADALQRVCREIYQTYEPLRAEWEQRHRSKVLYWTNWNYAPLILREPISSLEDLKGKRIRGYGVATDVIEALGGTAIPMAAPEVYPALERGILDGIYGFDFITAVAYKLHEIAPNFYDIGDGPHAPSAVIMNKAVYDGLPDDVRKVSDEIVDEIYGGKFAEIYDGALSRYVATAQAEGVSLNTVSDEEKERARGLVQPAQVNTWIETVATQAGIDGEEMQSMISEAIAKYDPEGTLRRPYEIAKDS
ncbi:C4-dicarboxylate TRAP transporter substrate-binding protein [Roseospira goensis]|uniref:TRAP-type C4-dicarboxylate transport system substrate-binding protein n=1 Tax=Roseospira goensis TaxID=391922 RepID=A0A7W6WMK4_9PROT|nr:C4-dicarboxylate TRAP transporter substrate-binding protein [Roseospira goensis]MBB4287597.1 TRAP-type C4-dicarboxylate transport system substrate-binding protein [Roseospira goensis]